MTTLDPRPQAIQPPRADGFYTHVILALNCYYLTGY
jgi:hypothetical protein